MDFGIVESEAGRQPYRLGRTESRQLELIL